MCSAEGQRERGRGSQADSTLSTEPCMVLDLTNLRSQYELKPRVRHLTDCATQAPLVFFLTMKISVTHFSIVVLSRSSVFKGWGWWSI